MSTEWPLLSDTRPLGGLAKLGKRVAPLRELLSVLATRPYASKVHYFTSHEHLLITTAPNYAEQQDNPDAYRVIIGASPVGQRFRVGYDETPEAPQSWRTVDESGQEHGCWELCDVARAVELMDMVIPRDLAAIEAKASAT